MELWERIMPHFRYDQDVPFFEMLVPTVDTVRFGYLMEKLISVNRSVLFTGTTGVGKVCFLIHIFIHHLKKLQCCVIQIVAMFSGILVCVYCSR